MALQNIFDNEIFFEGYQKLREREVNANILFEIPAINSLLPELKGLRILDLGCGCGDRWTKDENGRKLYLNLADYGREGERDSVWFVEGIKKYHRMFSTVINDLIDAGFAIEKTTEPEPDEELLEKYPEYEDLFHKPDFLLVKAKRLNM